MVAQSNKERESPCWFNVTGLKIMTSNSGGTRFGSFLVNFLCSKWSKKYFQAHLHWNFDRFKHTGIKVPALIFFRS